MYLISGRSGYMNSLLFFSKLIWTSVILSTEMNEEKNITRSKGKKEVNQKEMNSNEKTCLTTPRS